METNTLNAVLVEKEELVNAEYPNKPATDRTEEETKVLKEKLRRATTLGNIDHNKIRIIFKDIEGVKEVRTTIWATGDKNIVLKKGIIIPINRIIEVYIY